jgi:probable HAF family extracellular repeat protein
MRLKPALSLLTAGLLASGCITIGSSGSVTNSTDTISSRFDVRAVDQLPASSSQRALAINNFGSVVGSDSGPDGPRGFFWNVDDGTTSMHGGSQGQTSETTDIADGPVASGWYDNTAHVSAYLSESGGAEFLDPYFSAGTDARAFGVNSSGTLVGSYNDGSGDQAFRTVNGTGQDIPGLVGESEARGINQFGDTVGWQKTGGLSQAFLSSGSSVTPLGYLPGGSESSAEAISRFGSIVGWSGSASGIRGFVLPAGGSMVDLGVLPSQSESRANGINKHGVVVGSSGSRAFAWKDDKGLIDLNSRLNHRSKGWTLIEAYDVNDHGWIVGRGLLNGVERAFVAIPN